MKLLNFPIIKLTIFLIIGILISQLVSLPIYLILSVCLALIVFLAISLFISRNQFEKTPYFGSIAFLIMIFIGMLVVDLHDQKSFKNHYSQLNHNSKDSSNLLTIRIREVLKPQRYYDKYVVDLLKINDLQVNGKLLLNVKKDSVSFPFNVDMISVIASPISSINPVLNPNQFDYKAYLEKQYIYDQIFTSQNNILVLNSEPHTLFGYADRLRALIDSRLRNYDFKPDEIAIIDALLLGQRKDMNKELYDNYSHAGAVHILAVSGLHVGVLLLLLQFVLKPLNRLKFGKYIKILLIIFLLCGFAIVAGLSASVTRAVAMFSIVAFSMNINRHTNIYNTLAISMFFILLFKPMFLFDVGFQMSYLAVISIVTIQPMIVKFWRPKNKIGNYLWNIFTVTIAAQVGVLPISLYYFHQFPSLFLISNLAIIPALGTILGFGIIIIIFALLNILPNIIAKLYSYLISGMNYFIEWIADKESFLLTDIPFSIALVLASYLGIIAILTYVKKPSYKALVLILTCGLLVQSVFIYQNLKSQTNELVILQKNRSTIILNKRNYLLQTDHNLDPTYVKQDVTIKNYRINKSISIQTENELKSIYQVGEAQLFVIDSLGVYKVQSFEPTYVLMRNSPKINLTRMIDLLQPKFIIADGSNYSSYVKRWKATCLKQKIPFHLTSEKGAFVIKYD